MPKSLSFRKDAGKMLLGLIGAGIQASRSPAMHECEAAENGLRCLYQLIDLNALGLGTDALPELLSAAEYMGFAGLNITHPCKQLVIPFLDELSEDARALGAVNSVVLRNGKRSGHNTDWIGFGASFDRGLGGAAIDRIVQFGAGGAGAATAYAMLRKGAGRVTIVDPDAEKSAGLVARLAAIFGEGRIVASTDIEASLRIADGVVHATPMGMHGYPGVALPVELLRKEMWVAEIVYFPLETELLRAARAAGCATVDGGWMAVNQAAEAFRLFSGLEPDYERMHRYFVKTTAAK